MPLAISLGLHGGVAVAVLLGQVVLALVSPAPEPLITDSLEVAVVSLPKSDTKMPDRAARAPKPPPSPEPAPVEQPPPVKESELVHKTETPQPKPGTADAAPSMDDLVAENDRRKALEDLMSAPEGPVDRLPTDPDGTGDEVIGDLTSGVIGDAELARWNAQAKSLFQSKFNPFGDRDDLVARAKVVFDPSSGRVLEATLVQKSGVLGFDAAVERALAQVREIPLPPAKYREQDHQYFFVEFVNTP